jgi:flagellar hook-basal body complex protein FliE
MVDISNIQSVVGPGISRLVDKASSPGETQGADGKSFADTLTESLQKVNQLQQDADQAIENLVTGKSENIHDAMIALNKADMAFRMTMQMRNKIVEAYQEVLRMQV